MYLRIMNQLDLECMRETLKNSVVNEEVRECITVRLEEIVHIFDEIYSFDRNSFSYGGFVFLITEENEAQHVREKIISCYHLKDMLEYCDCICQDKENVWYEELYLRSSEDGVIIIYPKEINKEEK